MVHVKVAAVGARLGHRRPLDGEMARMDALVVVADLGRLLAGAGDTARLVGRRHHVAVVLAATVADLHEAVLQRRQVHLKAASARPGVLDEAVDRDVDDGVHGERRRRHDGDVDGGGEEKKEREGEGSFCGENVPEAFAARKGAQSATINTDAVVNASGARGHPL